jgi:TatD DNase family protein
MAKFINLHTHNDIEDSDVIALLNRHQLEQDLPFLDSKIYTVGLHPWHISEKTMDSDLNWLKKTIISPNVIAIGECGLDRLIEVPMQLQEHVFKQHIAFSELLQKPLILHCVRAHERILQLRKQLKPTQSWVFHGFDKNLETGLKCIEAGCFLSFGSAILKNKTRFEGILKAIPLNRIFFETDITNYQIQEIYAFGSKILELKNEDLVAQLEKNLDFILKIK